MNTIVFTGGGTAGHVMPALALIPRLKENFGQIYYIGSVGGMEENIVKGKNIPYYAVSTAKLQRKFTLKNFAIPAEVMRGYKQAKKLLKKLRPDVVFSKGGYVAVPVVFAAKSLKIPVVTHESDFSAGLANKLIAPKADKVLTAFSETAKRFPNGEYTGLPLGDELFAAEKSEALARYGFSGKKPVLLVLGGSQGSRAINAALSAALDDLLPKFDILHLYGGKNKPISVSEGYKGVAFESEMRYAYAAADVAVTRAGASALFELLALKIPSVVIPLPAGTSRGDQVQNAEYFAAKGAICLLYENNLTAKSLETAISSAYADRYNFKRRLSAPEYADGAARVAEVLGAYAGQPNS
ncbi:MAG: undecaprenyldiphospho-muramoylpentapeptide beta-N-acetylglucosaminyltransferase [Bacillota bacterium]|nr:MAG: undecaprenyldiphospho-muramoylpentapeptide beta-N-acetylglucosaminyltransferase [Bacillota bacterium]